MLILSRFRSFELFYGQNTEPTIMDQPVKIAYGLNLALSDVCLYVF